MGEDIASTHSGWLQRLQPWHLRMLMILGLTMACTAHAESPETLTVRWMPSCAIATTAPFFTVTVSAAGEVRYTGGTQTKVTGEQRSTISSEDARRVFKEAGTLLKSRMTRRERILREKQLEEDGVDYAYCLEISRERRGRETRGRYSSDAVRAQGLIQLLTSVVNAEQWVCPQRVLPPRRPLSTYCSAWNDEPIALTFIGPASCSTSHDVAIHIDGTVYYYVYRLKEVGKEGRKVLTTAEIAYDNYYSISQAQVSELLQLIRTFDLEPFTDRNVSHPSTAPRLYVATDARQAGELKEQLRKMLNIEWFSDDTPSIGCAEGYVRAVVYLRPDLK